MMTPTGGNLSVLIITEANQDWQTFATWYSFYKNVPEAKVFIACIRNKETPFQYFQWAKRLKIRVLYPNIVYEDKILTELGILSAFYHLFTDTILVIPPLFMAIDTIDELSEFMNNNMAFFGVENDVLLANKINRRSIDDMINECMLYGVPIHGMKLSTPIIKEAKETKEICSLVSLQKGCGKWINTLRGCPLSNAEGLISENMTMNENRVMELWKRMVALYSAVSQ